MGMFNKFVGIILFFPLIVFFFLFTYNLVQDMGDDYIIAISYNETFNEIDAGQLNVSAEMRQFLEDSEAEYYATTIPIDLFFIAFIIDAFLITIWSAFMARKKSIFSFYGIITFGSMVFLFVGTFINQVVVWLFENFYFNFFNLTRTTTPMAQYYIEHSLVISLIWFVVVFVINQFDIQMIMGKIEGRFQE